MKVGSKDIAARYGLRHLGVDRAIHNLGSLNSQAPETLLWAKSLEGCKEVHQGVLIASAEFEKELNGEDVTYLLTYKSPRLMFAILANDLFPHLLPDNFINCVTIHRKNPKIKIGEGCFIGKNVTIGDGTEILHNTSIFSNTQIGEHCHINTNCSIATPGLGFEYDGDDIVKFPQIGGVIIGNQVEIGPNTTIRRGALDNTIVSDGCKIGSLSNIGHNCYVGRQCILTCQIVLGGSSRIGDKVFMGINSSVKNKVQIGSNVTVGMGAVVTRSFPDDVTIVGIPAQVLKTS